MSSRGCEPDLVENDQIVAQDGLDGVVGQGPVEGLDQVSGGEVLHLCPAATAAPSPIRVPASTDLNVWPH